MTQYSGVYTLQTQGQAITSGQWATDPYYKNTTLLLHADGVAGGAQNNTFLDGSTYAAAVTRAGNTTQGSFSPYGPTWSNYFDGTGDYLSVATNAALNLGSSDFTVECWVYLTAYSASYSGNYTAMLVGKDVSGAREWFFSISGTASSFTALNFVGFTNNTTLDSVSGSYAFALNTWYHVAATRSGNTLRSYVNGVIVGTNSSYTTTCQTTASDVTVGAINYGSGFYYYTNGYISNARLVKGTAVYTGDFIPPTAPLTNITNTSLLTCQSNRFIDNSSNAFAITLNGNPSVQRLSPFPPQYQYTQAVIGGSGYFDGTGDYLTSTAPALGTGNLTFEFWIYPLDGSATYRCVYDNRVSGDGNSGYGIFQYGAVIEVYNASLVVASAAGSIKANAWNHVSFVRSSGTCQLYINGVASGSSASSTTNCYATDRRIATASTLAYYYYGYITDLRENATAVTPTAGGPTSPVPAISGTQLLLNMTNAGIYDNAMMNDLETVGNAQVSTSVVKYGSGSLAFDGSGDYLSTLPQVGQFGTGDFTVEAWVNTSSTSTENIASLNDYNSNGWALGVNYPSTGNFFWYSNSAAIVYSSGAVLNTWVHVAVVRASGVLSLFVNGVLRSTAANTTNYSASSSLLVGNDMSNQYFTGYIDDLRITKGVARYTGNFIPPQVAFANQ